MPDRSTITNTSCLIGLGQIGCFDLLRQLYSEVTIPNAVAAEWGELPPSWVHTTAVANQALVQSLRSELGAGEAEAIALSMEVSTDRLILDDRLARRAAQRLNLPLTGTVGVILRAKERGFIRAVKPILDDLVKAEFYMSPALVQRALQIAGESP